MTISRLHMALLMAYPAVSVGGVIDGSTTSLWGGYALVKLVGAYAGSAIRVRESGGNTEADIGFSFDGSLNVSALLAHCGANDGYVVTWYDQSGGGNNMTQATTADQPMIVDAGSYCGEVLFDGSNDALLSSPFSSGTPTAFSLYFAGRTRTIDASIRAIACHNAGGGASQQTIYTQRFSPTHADDFISTVELGSSSSALFDDCLTSDASVYGMRLDRALAAASECALFVDGTSQTAISTSGAGATGSFGSAGWRLGGTTTQFARMAAKAFLIYETAHTNFATVSALITPTPPTLGLDSYTTNLWAVYSLRKQLTAYAGSCIRVRESSGNTEADIGFDADGLLDEAALLSHCGANSGFIVTWYDQSGNTRDFAQATTSNQPRIVNAGAVDRGITFDGSNDFMATAASSGTVPAFSVYVKGNLEGTGSQYAVEHSTNSDSNNAFALLYASRLLKVVVVQSTGSAGSAVQNYQANFVGNVICGVGDRSQGTKAAMATLFNGGLSQAAASASGSGSTPSGNYAAHPWHIGARSGGSSPMNGDMHTVVIYEAAHAAATIERISRAIG